MMRTDGANKPGGDDDHGDEDENMLVDEMMRLLSMIRVCVGVKIVLTGLRLAIPTYKETLRLSDSAIPTNVCKVFVRKSEINVFCATEANYRKFCARAQLDILRICAAS